MYTTAIDIKAYIQEQNYVQTYLICYIQLYFSLTLSLYNVFSE